MRNKKRLLLPVLLILICLLLSGCDDTKYPYIKVVTTEWVKDTVPINVPAGAQFVEYDVEDDGYTIILRFAKEDCTWKD